MSQQVMSSRVDEESPDTGLSASMSSGRFGVSGLTKALFPIKCAVNGCGPLEELISPRRVHTQEFPHLA